MCVGDRQEAPWGVLHVTAGQPHLPRALMGRSALKVPGKPPIAPEDAKVDVKTGTLRLYFPRSPVITASDKDVIFSTRFGSLNVVKKFHLAEMLYQGRLEL